MADRDSVWNIILRALTKWEPEGVMLWVVSGMCQAGADIFAEECVKITQTSKLKIGFEGFPIQSDIPFEDRYEFTRRAYARNHLIAEHSDVLFALVAPDRTGGTENTIEHARALGKPVMLCLQDGSFELLNPSNVVSQDPDETGAPQDQVPRRR